MMAKVASPLMKVLVNITGSGYVVKIEGANLFVREFVHIGDKCGDVDELLQAGTWNDYVCIAGVNVACAIVGEVKICT